MHPTDSQAPSVSSRSHGPITVVTLSRPDVRNAVDADTARALYAAFIGFEEDADAKVAVFHGAHGHFARAGTSRPVRAWRGTRAAPVS